MTQWCHLKSAKTYQRAQIKHCMSNKFLRTVGPWCATVYLIFGQIWYLEYRVSPDVRPCKKFMGKIMCKVAASVWIPVEQRGFLRMSKEPDF